jgi:hypothetical protein
VSEYLRHEVEDYFELDPDRCGIDGFADYLPVRLRL